VGVTLLLLAMSPLHALAFVALQQSLFGLYLGMSFAPNHKGMQLMGIGDAPRDFLRRQVLSSRNVVGGRLTDAVLGGLNYQIEHHLFPSMPSRNLRRARPLVRRFCDDRGIAYCETDLLTSYRRTLTYLRDVRPST
jgi:fatty acid desaturase